jgi:23S rRNA (cytidine1920-2'-O)/16S rRNA (cytidine1409-2'-O)-methyltransferase
MVQEGLAETREKARGLILAGKVRVDEKVVDKPGTRPKPGARVTVEGGGGPVGRGYHKLAEGVARLGLDVHDRTCLDAGASTGGFTEYLLEAGAAQVYAVDVGYGQLAWKLRQDPRVTVMERTNVRTCDPGLFDPRPTVLVADLSFISLAKVLPNLGDILQPGSAGVVLVKPQFEAGPARVEKGGLVRKAATHRQVLREVAEATRDAGWTPTGICPSPIRGAKGNLEFLLKLTSPGGPPPEEPLRDEALDEAVAEGHG